MELSQRGGAALVLALSLLAPGLLLSPAGAAKAQMQRDQKATVELVADRSSYAPGSSARLAVVMQVEDGWHVNSDTPTLDYLIPTETTLALPSGWPAPRLAYPPAKMLSFSFVDEPIAVFEGRVPILVDLEIPSTLAGDAAAIRAEVRYQACNDTQCLPPVTSAAELVLPLGTAGSAINTTLFGTGTTPAAELMRSSREASPTGIEPTRSAAGGAQEPAPMGSAPGANASVPQDAASQAGTAQAGTAQAGMASAEKAGAPKTGLLAILLLGLLGGLILNVMPCVLPVLSLKVFGLVKSAHGGHGEVARGGLMTALGILVSFWGLALAAIVARAAGNAVGWGVQFQEPGFVSFLAVVVMLFSLNLWGVFEIPVPARLANRLTGGGAGMAGHFGSGLFATLMATPCSAPFLGTAVSFALSRSALEIFAVFTAVGLGMALPFLALAVAPKTAKWLPRPGAWMDTLKGLMGFLLAAAAIWLFFVLAGQLSSARLAFVQLTMLALALFVWLGARYREAGGGRRALVSGGALASGLLAVFLAAGGGASASDGKTIDWLPFDEAQATALAREGHQVFVDVTADWCLTCKANEKLVLSDKSVVDAFDRHGVVAMKADWTSYDQGITDLLQRYGRSGIPFYLLYRPDAEPYVFGELLTRGGVVAAVSGDAGAVGAR